MPTGVYPHKPHQLFQNRSPKVKLICKICNKEFLVYPCHAKGRKKYCSWKCRNVGLKDWVGKKRYNYKGGLMVSYKKRLEVVRKHRKRCKDSWIGYIPLETKCEICGKKIFFKNHPIKETICFDHKNENCCIKKNPSYFLYQKIMNKKNQKIWESCNFGSLCHRCNSWLPTKNRKEWLRRVNKYVNRN